MNCIFSIQPQPPPLHGDAILEKEIIRCRCDPNAAETANHIISLIMRRIRQRMMKGKTVRMRYHTSPPCALYVFSLPLNFCISIGHKYSAIYFPRRVKLLFLFASNLYYSNKSSPTHLPSRLSPLPSNTQTRRLVTRKR